MLNKTMLFDQYSRYNALKQLLHKSEFNENKTLLDIGSGPECLLGSVLKSENITYLDPLITKENDNQYINANIFTDKLDGKKFNYTTAIDVLEHIPPATRDRFIEKLCELSDEYIIIAFPSSENQDAVGLDDYVNKEYRKIYAKDYPWLEEHFKYGLPSLKETIDKMQKLGWQCKSIGHGNASWLKNMLSFVIYTWDIAEYHNILLDMSEEFNLQLADYDFLSSGYYRDFVVASKKDVVSLDSLIKEKDSLLNNKFKQILNEAKAKVFETNFKVIQDEKKKLIEVSNLATGMRLRLEKIDNNFIVRNVEECILSDEPVLTITNKVIKKLSPNRLIEKYKFSKAKVSLDEVRKNVNIHQKVIIAFPIIPWSFRFQRPQHILKELSKQGYTIIYLSMNVASEGVLFNSIEDASKRVILTKLDDNIYQIWLHSYIAMKIYTDYISDENLNNLSLSIQSVLKVLKPNKITYMVQFPGWNRLVFDLKSKYDGSVVFDCMDDHSGFSTNNDDSLQEEIELVKKSDIVISSSQILYDKNIKLNHNTIQVKNGTEFEYFNNAKENGKLDHLSDKPIIGYYGAISDWFDIDMVEYCAKKLSSYNFVMIGSTLGCDISSAKKISNIHFLGEIPYRELSGYLAYFDVCLIPFKITPLTLATNPVKFYEYLSAGKPVVSVELPELMQYGPYCYLAKDKESFCIKIDEALNEASEDKIRNRIKLAQENSWSQRANLIYEKIK